MENVVRTQRLEIVNDKGEVKALFGLLDVEAENQNPFFTMFDVDGIPRIIIAVENVNPKIEILDKGGKPQLILTVQYDGSHLSFYDERGIQRFSVDMSDGYPILNMLTPQEEVAFAVGLQPNGSTKMLGTAENGEVVQWPPTS
jgi:hypothetical protein